MRHIFLAHSFITYLVGRLTAAKLGLSREQQVILRSRRFEVNPSDQDITVDFPYKHLDQPFPTFTRCDKAWRRVLALDRFINELTSGDEFRYYTFDTSTRYNQIIGTHKRCCGYYVIEEGSASYRESSYLQQLFRWPRTKKDVVWDFLNYGKRFRPKGFLEKGTPVFCLTEDAFPGVSDKQVVFDRGLAKRVSDETKVRIPSDSLIVVHDWSSEKTLRDYVALFMHAMEPYRGRPMFQKHHPGQTEKSIDAIDKANRLAGFEIETIECPLESYIFDDQPYQFLGHHSSTLMYAKLFGKSAKNVFDFPWGTVWDFDGFVLERIGRTPKVAVFK